MKRATNETTATTNNVIAQNVSGAQENVLAKLSKMETMSRDVRRQHAANAAYRPIPDDQDALFQDPHNFTVSSIGVFFYSTTITDRREF